jgi:hypothetical protein
MQHINEARDYLLGGSYEIRFCADINYEMLIIDNSAAVMFFRMDDPDKRSWIQHADPIHVAFVHTLFNNLMAKSIRLSDVSDMDANQLRAWLRQAHEDLLKPVKPGNTWG